MKSSVFLFTVSIAIVSASINTYIDQLSAEVKTARVECAKQVGASVDDVNELSQGKIPNSKAGKCLISCIFKLFGAQDLNGKINKQGDIEKIEELKPIDANIYNKFSSVWKTCSGKTSDDNDGCGSAANLMVCLAQGMDKEGLSRKLLGL